MTLPWNATLIAAGLAQLAYCLSGNPGVTALPPSGQFLSGGLVCALGALGLGRHGLRGLSPVLWCCLAFCAWSLVSLTNTQAAYLSDQGMASIAGFLGMCLCFGLGPTTRRSWSWSAIGLVLVAGVSGLFGLVQFLGQHESAHLQANFTNPDTYSLISLIGLFLAIGLAVEARGVVRVLWGAFVCLFFIVTLLTASRAAAVAMLMGYLSLLFVLISSQQSRWRAVASKMAVVPFAVIVLLIASPGSLQLSAKLGRLSDGSDVANLKSRLDVARYGYRTVLRNPLTGSGLGCFSLVYQKDRPALALGEDFMNVAHNDYIQWFVETGVIGGLLWILLLVVNAGTTWSSFRSPTPWVASQLALVVCIATFCALNFACPVPTVFAWVGACFGLTASLSRLDKIVTLQRFAPTAFPLTVAVLALGLWTTHYGWCSLQSDREQQLATSSEKSLDLESAIGHIRKASTWLPKDPGPYMKAAIMSKRAFVFSGKGEWIDSQGLALLEAHKVSPLDLRALLLLVRFRQSRRQFKEATDLLTQASAFAPSNPHLRREMVRNSVLQGNLKLATEQLAEIDRIGVVVDDETLALLIGWQEDQAAGRGIAYLDKVDQKRALELGLRAAADCVARKRIGAAQRILSRLAVRHQDNLKVQLELALAHGLAGDTAREIGELEKLLEKPALKEDEQLESTAWQRWAVLRKDHGEVDLVEVRLEAYLLSHPREFWARVILAQFQLERKHKAKAREMLSGGLPYDTDGSVRIQLAQMCEQQGLISLARSYYEEALPLSTSKEKIRLRLSELQKAEEALDAEGSE